MPQLTSKQIDKIQQTIKSVQKAKSLNGPPFGSAKKPALIDTDSDDSYKNLALANVSSPPPPSFDGPQEGSLNLIEASSSNGPGELSPGNPDSEFTEFRGRPDGSTLISTTSATSRPPPGPGAASSSKPSHPFDEPHDQLRDESAPNRQTEGLDEQPDGQQHLFAAQLNRANQREESQARWALEQMSLDQASKLSALNAFSQQQQLAMPHLMRPKDPLEPNRQLVVQQQQLTGARPQAITARTATSLSESHTIDLMTRMAERMAQLEAKKLLDMQQKSARNSNNRSPSQTNANQQQVKSHRNGLLDSISSIFNSQVLKKDKRRMSNNNNDFGRKFVPQQANQQQPLGMSNAQIITASPLNLSLFQPNRLLQQNNAFLIQPHQMEKLMSEASSTSNKVLVEPKPAEVQPAPQAATTNMDKLSSSLGQKYRQQQALRSQQRTTAPKAASQASETANRQQSPTSSTSSGADNNVTSRDQTSAGGASLASKSLMSPEQESRFYSGQQEHLIKLQQQQMNDNLQLQQQRNLNQQANQQQAIRTYYSPQSSNVQESIAQPNQPMDQSQSSSAAHGQQVDSFTTIVEQPNGQNELVTSYGPPAATKIANELYQQQQQQQSTDHQQQMVVAPDQMASYLEFPMSPQQWSSEAMKSINEQPGQQQQQQQQQAADSTNSNSHSDTSNSEPDEANNQDDQSAASAAQEHQNQQPNDFMQYEIVEDPGTRQNKFVADPASQLDAIAVQQSNLMNQFAQQLHQHPAGRPQVMSSSVPHGFYVTGRPNELPSQFPFFQHQQSPMFSNFNPMQQPAMSASSPQLDFSSTVVAPTPLSAMSDLSLASFPAMSSKSAAKVALRGQKMAGNAAGAQFAFTQALNGLSNNGPQVPDTLQTATNDMNQLANFQSGLAKSVASQANNLTGMSLLTGNLRNQMQNLQARLPQMPQMPNIPQPPQLPNLPMPPPGMMQMAGLALPFAMARATRNSNRFRNNQVNAAASAGGSTRPTSAGQRLIQSATNLTNRLVRNNRRRPRRPTTSTPQMASATANKIIRSPSTSHRRPVFRLLQTVVDMSRQRPIQTASSLINAATTLAGASSASAPLGSMKPAASLATDRVAAAVASATASAISSAGPSNSSPSKLLKPAGLRRRESKTGLFSTIRPSGRSLREHMQEMRENANVILPGSIPAVVHDGSVARFASMTSPVDLLARQIQRHARELAMADHYNRRRRQLARGDEWNQLANAGELLRLNSLIQNNNNHHLQRQTAPTAADQQQQHAMMFNRSSQDGLAAPLVANHINLLLFTAQNVTENLLRLKPELADQQQQSQVAANEEPSAEQPPEEAASPASEDPSGRPNEEANQEQQVVVVEQPSDLHRQTSERKGADEPVASPSDHIRSSPMVVAMTRPTSSLPTIRPLVAPSPRPQTTTQTPARSPTAASQWSPSTTTVTTTTTTSTTSRALPVIKAQKMSHLKTRRSTTAPRQQPEVAVVAAAASEDDKLATESQRISSMVPLVEAKATNVAAPATSTTSTSPTTPTTTTTTTSSTTRAPAHEQQIVTIIPAASTSTVEYQSKDYPASQARPAADYVRGIKLIRGVAYPWPPPTKSSKLFDLPATMEATTLVAS